LNCWRKRLICSNLNAMTTRISFCFLLVIIAFTACKHVIKPEEVIGKWRYIKVSNPYSRNPDDTVSARELNEKSPSVIFSQGGDMLILSEGKILSHGRYKLDGNNIRVTEQLADDKTRNFSFYIISLTDKQIIFETKEDDAVRVTATRVK